MPHYFRTISYCVFTLFVCTFPLFGQQPSCINFDSLVVDTNYVASDQSIYNFYTEQNIRFLTSNAIGLNDSIYGTLKSGCPQPNVTMGKYLFIKGAINVDFSQLDTTPNLIVFSVNAQCNQTYFYATNNGPLHSVGATQNIHIKSSTGVTTSYSEGTFIIEGPIYSFTFGGVGVGIDLICYEVTNDSCLFQDLALEKSSCVNDSFTLELKYHKVFPNQSGFAVYINDSLQGRYPYDSLPLSLGPLPANCDTTYNILLVDQLDTTCKALYIFENTCCQECSLSDLEVNIHNCLPDSFYRVQISLDYAGSVSDRFNIYTKSNQYIGTFSYSSLPLLFDKFPISGDTIEYLRICDNDRTNCCVEMEFEPLNCPPKCDVTNLKATFINCDSDSSYTIEIDFNDQSESGSSYDIFAQNEFFETKYTAAPFTLVNFPISGTGTDQIKICLTDHPDCCVMVDIESPNCASSSDGYNFVPYQYELIVDFSTITFREKLPSSHKITSYQIYDLNGRRITIEKNINVLLRDLSIPCNNIKTGIYFLLLQDINGHFLHFRFFKP